MENVRLNVEGDMLIIQVNLSHSAGRSASGKSEIVATTSGNVDVPGHLGMKLGLNIYKK